MRHGVLDAPGQRATPDAPGPVVPPYHAAAGREAARSALLLSARLNVERTKDQEAEAFHPPPSTFNLTKPSATVPTALKAIIRTDPGCPRKTKRPKGRRSESPPPSTFHPLCHRPHRVKGNY